jgi:hypothetical protein
MSDDGPAHHILQVIIRLKRCRLEDLIVACPTLTWNQVFLELDRLSRTGQIRLSMRAPGVYSVEPADSMVAFTPGDSS